MPTFTAIALDRLIEPGAAKSMTTVTNVSDSKLDRRNNTINSKLERMNSTSTMTTLDKKHHWAMIKPALYATPKSTPLPDSPSTPLPDSPSPYVVDHKRRGPRLLKSYSEDDVAARKRAPEEEKVGDNTKVAGKETTDLTEDVAYSVTCPVEQEHVNGISSGEPVISELSSSSAVQNGSAKSVEEGGELEDFLDPQDSMSAKSNTEGDSNSGVERSLYQTTPVAEFYDAWEGNPSKILELSFQDQVDKNVFGFPFFCWYFHFSRVIILNHLPSYFSSFYMVGLFEFYLHQLAEFFSICYELSALSVTIITGIVVRITTQSFFFFFGLANYITYNLTFLTPVTMLVAN